MLFSSDMSMCDAFDILRKLPDGGIVWIESAKDLAAAQERVKLFAASKPGEYVIFCQDTQALVAVPPSQPQVKAEESFPGKFPPRRTTNQVVVDSVAATPRRVANKK
jgi:hypothetical protein